MISCGQYPTLFLIISILSLIFEPNKYISPESYFNSLIINFKIVVFPEPLFPIKPNFSSSSNDKFKSCNILFSFFLQHSFVMNFLDKEIILIGVFISFKSFFSFSKGIKPFSSLKLLSIKFCLSESLFSFLSITISSFFVLFSKSFSFFPINLNSFIIKKNPYKKN